MVPWLKFIHIAAIAIWSAGLISIPGLCLQRAHVTSKHQLIRLQHTVRFAFVALISPAAFIAVASGTALIFLEQLFIPWLSVKLACVGALVFIHTLTGLVIIRLFRDGEIYPLWRFVATTAITLLVILAILYFVLVKPDLNLEKMLPKALSEPGALERLVHDINPWMKP